jgi:biopolymer transport protein ExbB
VEPTVAAAAQIPQEHQFWLIKAFVDGGPVMIIILLILVWTIGIIAKRFMDLGSLLVDRKDFMDQIFGMIIRGDIRQATAFCDARPAPLPNVVKSGLVQAMAKRPDEEIQVAMDASFLREQPRIEGGAAYLAVTGNIAVLAGLLGTIIGMIQSFTAVANADPASKAAELSNGISHALNCTAFGLSVAIISIVAYGYFQMKIQRAENEIIESSMSLLNLVAANRDKIRE